MRINRKDLLKVLLLGFAIQMVNINIVKAQDPQFSQYYAAPLYMNPAMAGINQQGRAGLNYRNQWPSIPNSFETFSSFFDYNFEDYNSSVGMIITSDREGLVGLRSTTIGLQYAYQVFFTEEWAFRPAIQASYTLRDVNFDKLVFGDQLAPGGVQNPTGENFNTGLNVGYFDLAIGGIMYTSTTWIGISYHNMLEPNQSLLDQQSVLPMRFSLHGGYKIPLNSSGGRGRKQDRSVTPTFNYRSQARFDQLEVGLYTTLEPIIFGLWYRGIPIKKFESFPNNESLIFMVGLIQNNVSIGYSYDYTLSQLGLAAGGAHELSLVVSFNWGDPSKPPRHIRQLRCPVPFMF